MKKEPTISIITASYNHAAFIGEAIESVKQQDYDSWELLIADDSSTDQSLEVLSSYTDDARIKVFSFKINREHHMRNFAASHAHGDYIAFLNSDDIFLPGKLRKQAEYLENSSQTAAVFTYVKAINENSERISDCDLEKVFTVNNRSRHEWLRHFFVSGNCLCISSALIRRDIFEQVGAFNPLLVQLSDMDLWIKTCFKWDIHVITEQLTGKRFLKDGKNLSALNPASASRLMLEHQHLYDHYFSETALEQVLEIFPELTESLPEDVSAWRYYLLCRIAISLPNKSARLNGFVKLHELLKKEKTTKMLLQKNPRLLRTMFISEGTAGICGDCPGMPCKVDLLQENSTCGRETLCSYWAAIANRSIVSFSFPNPETSGRLHMSIEAGPIRVICRQFRLYNQETGEIILNSEQLPRHSIDKPKNKRKGLTRPDRASNQWSTYPHFHLPEIDLTALSSKWIDIEIDIEIDYAPARPNFFLRLIRKILGERCSKVISSVLRR